ncbi:M56 family metallopeptidase [Pseudoxanthomonas sp.]|uniref:M56 family metallopeptidase n=1 Tax=Pseudoxanthomonas sp. TaxID=1871049 RepID=UPI0026275BF5|nr:M56 family metallopeptidase [Pseudoxanthomonas sp.]WDS34971.1 MAG: M56 family metallopeptidase [Pseudoxanthomonas sp.]
MDMIASELLQRLAATSVQTVLLAALVWALCRALPRLPASTQCWLWWSVSLQAVLGLVARPLELALLPAAPVEVAPVFVASANATTQAIAGLPEAAAQPVISWQLVVLALWAAGVLVMLARTTFAWNASRRLVRDARLCTDAVLVGALRLATEAHGLRRTPPLLVSTRITSPQLVGVFAPSLLLPAHGLSSINDDDLDMALTHELVHLRRCDLAWGLLPALAQHLFFFHPLIHLALREYGVAREAAVDAAVVAGNRHCRSDYGRLLMRLGVAPRPGAGLASASPSYLSLKRRLLMLQHTDAFPRLGAALILAFVGVVGVTPLRLVAQTAPAAKPVVVTGAKDAADAMPAAAPAPAAAAAPAAMPVTSRRVPPPPAAVPPPPPAPPVAPPAPPVPPRSITGLSIHDQHSVVFQRDQQTYVIRDPATVQRLNALHAPSRALGQQQGALGRQQGELGRQMAQLSTQVSDRAMQQAQVALAGADKARAAAMKAHEHALRSQSQQDALRDAAAAAADAQAAQIDADAIRRQVDAAMHDARQQGMEQKIAALAEQQAQLGAKQADLGAKQADIAQRAAKEAQAIIDRAIKDGLAQRIDG